MTLLRIILAMIAGLVVLWLVLIALLWRYKPDERRARDLLLPKLMSGQLDVSGIALPDEVAA